MHVGAHGFAGREHLSGLFGRALGEEHEAHELFQILVASRVTVQVEEVEVAVKVLVSFLEEEERVRNMRGRGCY